MKMKTKVDTHTNTYTPKVGRWGEEAKYEAAII